MLQSKKLNNFFNECFKLNIQTTLDPELLEYYYSLYGVTEVYKAFEQFVLEKYGKSGGGIFDAKNKMIFKALESIIIRPHYYMFSRLHMNNFSVSAHELFMGLIEFKQFKSFNDLIRRTYGKMTLFKEVKKYIKEKEKDLSFVGKPIDKKMRGINNFINDWEEENSKVLEKYNAEIKSFIKIFISYHSDYFKNFYKIKVDDKIEDVKIATRFFNRRFSGKYILSIDITKANHQILQQLGAVKNVSFFEFIGTHTDDSYLKINKSVRQVLYGNLNGGRLGKFQRTIMIRLYKLLKEKDPSLEIYIRSDDELIIVLEKDIRKDGALLNPPDDLLRKSNALGAVKHLQQLFKTGLEFKLGSLEFNIETYRMAHIETNVGDFFLKEFNDAHFEIKSSDSKYYPQIYKIIKGLEINDNDLIFEDRNIKQMVKFVNPLEVRGGTFKVKPIKKKKGNFLINFFNKLK